MRKALTPAEYIPVSTIKSCFSWRLALNKKGKITCESSESEEREEIDGDSDSDSDYSDDSDDSEANEQVIQTSSVTAFISVAVSGVDMEKDEWMVVGYPSGWYPGQFVQFDCKEEEINILIFIFYINHLQIVTVLYGLNCLVLILIYRGK